MLKKFMSDLFKCDRCRCSDCREVCPIFKELRFESYYARGRVLAALAISEGKLSYTPSVTNYVYTCLTCKACTEKCELHVDVPSIVREMRAEIIKQHLKPPQLVQTIIRNIQKYKTPFGNLQKEKRISTIEGGTKRSKVAYFPGCYTLYRVPEIYRATINILEKTGYEVLTLSESECCGYPAYWVGDDDSFFRLANENARVIQNTGLKELVLSCPSCYMSFKYGYPEIGVDINLRISHLSEFLVRLLKRKRINANTEFEKTVTYHDPCHLGRYGQLYDAPREVIKSIPGVQFVEMEHSRENAMCCGGGAGVTAAAFPNISMKIAKKRLQEAVTVGAELIVSSCPYCYTLLNLAKKTQRKMEKIEVGDLSTLMTTIL